MSELMTQQIIDWLKANQGKMTDRMSREIVGSLERIEAERDEAIKEILSLTKEHAEISDENERLEDLLSRVACVATGGKLSKTNYDMDTYSEAINEYLCAERDEAFAEGQNTDIKNDDRLINLIECAHWDEIKACDCLCMEYAECIGIKSENERLREILKKSLKHLNRGHDIPAMQLIWETIKDIGE